MRTHLLTYTYSLTYVRTYLHTHLRTHLLVHTYLRTYTLTHLLTHGLRTFLSLSYHSRPSRTPGHTGSRTRIGTDRNGTQADVVGGRQGPGKVFGDGSPPDHVRTTSDRPSGSPHQWVLWPDREGRHPTAGARIGPGRERAWSKHDRHPSRQKLRYKLPPYRCCRCL